MYATVGTDVFTALLLIENPETVSSGFIDMYPVSRDVPLSPFSFNMRNSITIYFNSYYSDGERGDVGNAIILTVTLTEPLSPTDNITTYRYFFETSIDDGGRRGVTDYERAEVIIYESSKY